MESDWKYGCAEFGLSGWVKITGLFIWVKALRVARLNPPVVVLGFPYTHLFQFTENSVYKGALVSRLLTLYGYGPFIPWNAPGNFPWGYTVFPDN